MTTERLLSILTTLKPSANPYLNGAWSPLHEEVNAGACTRTNEGGQP